MLETNQPWNLFGYDLSRGPHYFRAGWRDFLWGSDSPVLGSIDEVVQAHLDAGGSQYYKAGVLVAPPPNTGEVLAQAIVLPDDLVLARKLQLPPGAEAELDSVASLEVTASSPFPEADTCYGWVISDRNAEHLDVHLAISSRSAVMAHIAQRMDSHDVHAYEVWAPVEQGMVQLSGFGEGGRQQRNRRRLGRMALTGAYSLMLIMAMFAIAAGAKYFELQKVRSTAEIVQNSASDAVELRRGLSLSKAMIASVNEMLARYPSPHRELVRLSALLGDDTWLDTVEIKGPDLKIGGKSKDASAVMQTLLDHPAYARVEAPVAIKKMPSGAERFMLEVSLADRHNSE